MLWLLWELRTSEIAPIVMGGLIPEVLSEGQEPSVPLHQGTTDVDVHLELELGRAHVQLAGLEGALRRASFLPIPKAVGGWQWYARVEDAPVRIDLLCDNPEVQAEHVVSVSDAVGVLNLRGTGYVLEDFETREISGTLADGSPVSTPARFAGLAGYVLTKCISALNRQQQKDYYDLAYVLLYNRDGGPRAVVQRVVRGPLRAHLPELQASLRELRERYRAPASVGTNGFVTVHELASPGGDRAQLAADAVAAVNEFVEGLLI